MTAHTTSSIDDNAGSEPQKKVQTTLERNPFWVLGATTRDSKQRIGQLADEKSLTLDPTICHKARSDLLNPRTRLGAEVAWLPGVSPGRAIQLVNELLQGRIDPQALAGLPPLARANFLAASLDTVDAKITCDAMATLINELACLVGEISLEDTLRDINEDRAVAGFTPVTGQDRLEPEFILQRRCFLSAINGALNKLPSLALVHAVTQAVESGTAGGKKHAPSLIDELVDSYEVEAVSVLTQEAENVRKLICFAKDAAKTGEDAVKPIIGQIEAVARNWDLLAQPIQVSAKARGIHHEQSGKLASDIRDCAAFLAREFGMLDQAKRLIAFLQDIFKELPEFSENMEQDAREVDELVANRATFAASHEQWCKDITYRVDFGTLFKDTLWISPHGVCWKKLWYPLSAITRVRWGGTRHFANRAPVYTTYIVAFGDEHSEALVELNQKDQESIYTTFTDKLWKAVCSRLVTELLQRLRSGDQVEIGTAIVHDDHIRLVKHNLFEADESVALSWSEVQAWSQDGAFNIASKNNNDIYAVLSYINVPNVHILEQAIRVMFKEPSAHRLSYLLE